MAEPPPTRLHIDPPIEQWEVTPRNGRTKPVIATGHQPSLWHPGILAKDIAADAFAEYVGGRALHVVVEHNPLEPLGIDLPVQVEQRAGVRSVSLDLRPEARLLPPNRLPPLSPNQVIDPLREEGLTQGFPSAEVGLQQITQAYINQADAPHLAAQTAGVLNELKQPYLHVPTANLSTSELVTAGFVQRMMSDPVACMRAYNRAVSAYPEANIRPLYVGRDVVEAPLWAQGDRQSVPVYIDLGDSRPQLFTQEQQLDLTGPDALQLLRPRAITLSAIMRSEHCDLFIHGTGGGVYDQVTERWWQDWMGEDLAPMAVVSADIYMPFDVPTASKAELSHAHWFRHHLLHNPDRHFEPTSEEERALVREKRDLLDAMDADRDKRRRAKAFKRIHAINAELSNLHREAWHEIKTNHWLTRVGVTNAAYAHRRDWCFALYPEEQLRGLADRIRAGLPASPK